MKKIREKRKEKLYQQWAKYSDLPSEVLPQEEAQPGDIKQRFRQTLEEEGKRRPNLLYILLLAAIVLVCIGIILLIANLAGC